MSKEIHHWMLHRELELMIVFALEVAARFEAAAAESDVGGAATYARGLVAAGTKVSRLVWPFGHRATDMLGIDEAGELRSQLYLDRLHPLAPARMVPLMSLFHLGGVELKDAVDVERRRIVLGAQAYPLDPIIDSLRDLQRDLAERVPAP